MYKDSIKRYSARYYFPFFVFRDKGMPLPRSPGTLSHFIPTQSAAEFMKKK
jgi:hypothetical protein